MTRRKTPSLDALQAEYLTYAALAEPFAAELVAQLRKLVVDAGISMAVPVQHRVKTWSSIADKIDRIQLRLKTIGDVQDLVGVRLILLFKRDVQQVVDLVANNCSVIRSYDAGQRLKTDQFGYSSAHMLVGLPEKWLAVPTLAAFGGLKAEIQVRTLAQHMWAETSQVLQYKREDTVPPSVRRGLYRGSALLELLDLEFDRILTERDTYRSAVDVQQADQALNVDNLAKMLDSLLPPENKAADESYAELLRELQHFGLTTTGKLRDVVRKHLEKAAQEDSTRVKEESDNLAESGVVSGTDEARVRRGVYFTHTGYVRNILRYHFGNDALAAYWASRRKARRKG